MQTIRFTDLLHVPKDVPDSYRFAEWVEQGVCGRSPAPHEILILTADGSFHAQSGRAGWGLTISLMSETNAMPGQFVGCVFGPLEADLLSVDGSEQQANAYLAEVLGLLWAGIIAFQLPYLGSVVCRADNMSALQGAQGLAGTTSHPLCVMARCVHLALRVLREDRLSYQHVPGHAGGFANELADGLAKIGAFQGMQGNPSVLCIRNWLRDNAAKARWLPHALLSFLRRGVFIPPMQQDVMRWELQPPAPKLPHHGIMAPFTRQLQVTPKASVTRSFLHVLLTMLFLFMTLRKKVVQVRMDCTEPLDGSRCSTRPCPPMASLLSGSRKLEPLQDVALLSTSLGTAQAAMIAELLELSFGWLRAPSGRSIASLSLWRISPVWLAC